MNTMKDNALASIAIYDERTRARILRFSVWPWDFNVGRCSVWVWILAAVLVTRPGLADDLPNVIVMLADDMGWMDSGAYGSQYYDTPNLDRLATKGVRFTNAYSASPLCSPTRLSILTGKYPHRLGMTQPAGHLPPLPAGTPLYGGQGAAWQAYLVPKSRRFLPNDADTYGKLFNRAGYATAFMGKWHLGTAPHYPEQHGFDVVVGGRGNPGPPGGYFAPWRSDTLPKRPEGTHIDDAITDEALRFIQANRDRPFLLNLWFYDVHAPFEGKESLVNKYRVRNDPRGQQDCPVMGAMIETLDQNVGRVLDKLDELGLRQNTIIVFWSDNGGNMYNEVDGTTPTNNAPLKAGKGNIHEGGIRVPAIIDWPGVTKPGTVSDVVVSTIDIYPTLLQMTGLPKPSTAQFDGVGLESVLRGNDIERDTMFFHFPHYVPKPKNVSASAVRHRDYKLIRRYHGDGSQPYSFELYHLGNDIGESDNLAERMPGLVTELDAMIDEHLESTGTPVPPPNPAYDPKAYNPITGIGNKKTPARVAPVGDWTPSKQTQIRIRDGELIVVSNDNDPWFMTRRVPEARGPIRGRVRMKTSAKGKGQMFWTSDVAPKFVGHHVTFNLKHDGQWHEYEAELPVEGQLKGFRLDPAQSPGEIQIDWIELLDKDGRSLKRWEFDDA